MTLGYNKLRKTCKSTAHGEELFYRPPLFVFSFDFKSDLEVNDGPGELPVDRGQPVSLGLHLVSKNKH